MSTTKKLNTKVQPENEQLIEDAQVIGPQKEQEPEQELPKLNQLHIVKLKERQKVNDEIKEMTYVVFELEKQIEALSKQKDELVAKRDSIHEKSQETASALNKEIYETYGGVIQILSEEGHYQITQPAEPIQ